MKGRIGPAWTTAAMRLQWSGWAVVVLISCLCAPRLSLATTSRYTSLAKQCRNTFSQRHPARECVGVGGWHIVIVSEPERSYLVVARGGYVKNLRDEVFSKEVGQFPDIYAPAKPGANPLAEWRLDARGVPRALIFRVYALDPAKSLQDDPNPYRSSLLVVRLGKIACVIGIVQDNDQARRLADSAIACGKGA